MLDSSTDPSDPQPTMNWPEDGDLSAAEPPPDYTTQGSLRPEDAVPLARFVAADCRERGWAIQIVRNGTMTWVAPDDDLSEVIPRDTDPDVGIRLGTPSAGLVAVRFGSPRVAAAADLFLPETSLKAGGGAESGAIDLFYQSDQPPETTIRLYANGLPFWALLSTGETMEVPRVSYPDGVPMIWGEDCLPTVVEGRNLLDALNELSAAAAVAACLDVQEKDRRRLVRGFIGWLLSSGRDGSWVVQFFEVVRQLGGYLPAISIPNTCRSVEERLAAGKKVSGWTVVTKLLGRDTAALVRGQLGFDSPEERLAAAQAVGNRILEDAADGASITAVLEDAEALAPLAYLSTRDLSAYEAILVRLRESGVKAKDVQVLRKVVKKAARELPPDQDDAEEDGLIRTLAETICSGEYFAQDVGRKLYRYGGGVYVPEGEEFVKRRVKGLLEDWEASSKWSPRLADSVVEYIRVDSPELWERPPLDVINVVNGLLNVANGVMNAHTPLFLSTVQLPVTYDPSATCPTWENFISQVFDTDCRDFAWEVLGWLMTPDTSIQKAVLLLGSGGNGKSTWLEAMRSFLGDICPDARRLGESREIAPT